jgi:hypothetical protein
MSRRAAFISPPENTLPEWARRCAVRQFFIPTARFRFAGKTNPEENFQNLCTFRLH